ncbi:Cullin binding-domain-containing protein [Tuber brumale]|nr:Cullin binding-domain-containing protein [Tuber brumale]
MPPKKRPTAQPSSRITRSSTQKTTQRSTGAQSNTPAPPSQPSSASMSASTGRNATSSRKRKQAVIDLISSGDSEAEPEPDGATMGNSHSRHRKRRQHEPPAAKPTKKSAKKPRTARAPSPDTVLTHWFDELKGDTDEIMLTDSVPWMESLGVSPEGIAFWVIAYWCGAKGRGAIELKEFMDGMKALGIDTNNSLRRELPTLLRDIAPGSDQFQKFYWFCYEFFKAADAKYLPLDMACAIFTALLDEGSYSTEWTPSAESNNTLKAKKSISCEKFPHKHAFMEFLGSTPPPTKVITKDQYRQFIPFNEQVDTDFNGYTIETSVWPSLFDQFVTWSKEKQSNDEDSMGQS